jgi:hypothetical protein
MGRFFLRLKSWYPRVFSLLAAALLSAPTTATANTCDKFVGVWSWTGGAITVDMEVKADGTAVGLCAGCAKMTWSCSGNVFELKGFAGATMTLSPDGRQMQGRGGAWGGTQLAVRKSAPPKQIAAQAAPANPKQDVAVATQRRGAQGPSRVRAIAPGAQIGALAPPTGLYVIEKAIDFNVLDKVIFDANSKRLILIGHHDVRFGGPPIPYLQHLAVLLRSPRPEMTLNWTPDSARRVDAFFKRMGSSNERRKLVPQLTKVWENGRITEAARWFLATQGAKPKNPNAPDRHRRLDPRQPLKTRSGANNPCDRSTSPRDQGSARGRTRCSQ